jgi:hypothetical protein
MNAFRIALYFCMMMFVFLRRSRARKLLRNLNHCAGFLFDNQAAAFILDAFIIKKLKHIIIMKYPHIIKIIIVFSLLISFLPGFGQAFQIGHQSKTYNDPARNNRNIPVEIYYPSTQSGNNVPFATGVFPVIVFGPFCNDVFGLRISLGSLGSRRFYHGFSANGRVHISIAKPQQFWFGYGFFG